jgi:hypothetical protein
MDVLCSDYREIKTIFNKDGIDSVNEYIENKYLDFYQTRMCMFNDNNKVDNQLSELLITSDEFPIIHFRDVFSNFSDYSENRINMLNIMFGDENIHKTIIKYFDSFVENLIDNGLMGSVLSESDLKIVTHMIYENTTDDLFQHYITEITNRLLFFSDKFEEVKNHKDRQYIDIIELIKYINFEYNFNFNSTEIKNYNHIIYNKFDFISSFIGLDFIDFSHSDNSLIKKLNTELDKCSETTKEKYIKVIKLICKNKKIQQKVLDLKQLEFFDYFPNEVKEEIIEKYPHKLI